MAAHAAEVDRLRSELETRFGRAILPASAPAAERFDGFRTGVAAIDSLLPHGIPRGTLSLWTGEATAGRTAALRALVLHTCAEGATVALVDAGLTLDASFACTPAGPVEGFWVARPPDPEHEAEGAWAAEALLRAGVFDLVILDGCGLDAARAHRLRTLARERNAAVVVTKNEGRGKREEGRGTATAVAACQERPASVVGHETSLWREFGRTGEHRRSEVFLSSLFPLPSSLPFRADVRLEFRGAAGVRAAGLMPGGRFRRRMWVVLAKHGTSAPGEREVEVVHEPADCLRTHRPAPDRSPGGR
jgi:hypothetical protein